MKGMQIKKEVIATSKQIEIVILDPQTQTTLLINTLMNL